MVKRYVVLPCNVHKMQISTILFFFLIQKSSGNKNARVEMALLEQHMIQDRGNNIDMHRCTINPHCCKCDTHCPIEIQEYHT